MDKVYLVKYNSKTTWGTPYFEEYAFSNEVKAVTFIEDRTQGLYDKVNARKYVHKESGSSYTIEPIEVQ